MLKKTLLTTAAAAAVLSFAATAQAADAEKEKCYGVAKAGKNDCGNPSGSHGCAGASKVDSDANEWIYVLKGTCDRLTGGSTSPKDAAPPEKQDKSAE